MTTIFTNNDWDINSKNSKNNIHSIHANSTEFDSDFSQVHHLKYNTQMIVLVTMMNQSFLTMTLKKITS